MKRMGICGLLICVALLISCSAKAEEISLDVLQEKVKTSVHDDYMLNVDRPYQEIQSVELKQTGKGKYAGKIVSIIHVDDPPETVESPVTVTWDGKTIIWEAKEFGKFEIAYEIPKAVKGLDLITLKISSQDIPFYKIELSNSTMEYLSSATETSGLGQIVYIPQGYYNTVTEYLLYINKIFKEKRVFTEEEISNIQNVYMYLSQQTQSLTTETYGYITASSFPDGNDHDLVTSIYLIVLMYLMSSYYASSLITENYQISVLQEGIKVLSTGIPKEEASLFKEVFPGIYKEILIKRFVADTN
jgi:hypothetical protein